MILNKYIQITQINVFYCEGNMPYIDIPLPSSRTRVVAFSRSNNKEIIASGMKISTVLKKAKQAGCEDPFIMSVPSSNNLHRHFSLPAK